MSIASVVDWLLDNQAFQKHFHQLLVDSVCAQFGASFSRANAYTDLHHNWGYLLTCASLLAPISRSSAQETALRIAQHCISSPEVQKSRRDTAASILDSLYNKPAIALAERRDLLPRGVATRIPFPLYVEWIRRDLEGSVSLHDDAVLSVNRFQKSFWENIQANDWISVSAPTSAGKSFIITRWIGEYIQANSGANVVYIVPTRALIYQVEGDLKRFFAQHGERDVNVSSLPMKRALNAKTSNVFVFTQERFHIFLSSVGDDFDLRVLVVDEAHKVGDGHRGVLLQQVVEKIAKRRQLKIVFASPLTQNPELLLQDAPEELATKALVHTDVTVNQNLLWVSQVPRKSKLWNVTLCLPNEVHEIGNLELQYYPSHISKRLSLVAHAVGGSDAGNIVYVNGAADAEKTALQLYDALDERCELKNNSEIDDLIDLSKKTIHPQFLLAKVLRRGVAFHYGNMPLLVRAEIERLFSGNVVRYLVCTSTLMEGVNMACRNIFLRGPKKGRSHPMSAEDFWNLAGRAGRWGKEFQGNIFCVDTNRPDVWKAGVPRARRAYPIHRTTDVVISNPEELMDFIERGAPRAEALARPDLEYVFNYLVSQHLRDGSILNTAWARRYSDATLEPLATLVEQVSESLQTPAHVVDRNPGISPLAMDSLLQYFRERGRAPEEYIPAEPSSDDAVESYTSVFTRIYKHLGRVLGPPGGRSFMLALLVTRWMRGFPLPRLISGRLDYHKKRHQPKRTATVIRSVMEEVEQVARFEAPKYLACYSDILQLYLEELGRDDLSSQLMDLGVLLEYGVSQQTQIAMMSLGMSRASAIAASELIARDDMTEEECLSWLATNIWRGAGLPRIIERELEAVLEQRLGASSLGT